MVDCADLPADASWWQVDAVICALGSTIKAAGSQAAFAAVGRLARAATGRCLPGLGARLPPAGLSRVRG